MTHVNLSGVRIERETEKALLVSYRCSVSRASATYSKATEFAGWVPKSQVSVSYWSDSEYEGYFGAAASDAKKIHGKMADMDIPCWLFKKSSRSFTE